MPWWHQQVVQHGRPTGSMATTLLVVIHQPRLLQAIPHITVPAGYVFGHAGRNIVFWRRAYSEPTLIKIAYAFEQGTKARRNQSFCQANLSVRADLAIFKKHPVTLYKLSFEKT